jgi:hypothetical protein
MQTQPTPDLVDVLKLLLVRAMDNLTGLPPPKNSLRSNKEVAKYIVEEKLTKKQCEKLLTAIFPQSKPRGRPKTGKGKTLWIPQDKIGAVSELLNKPCSPKARSLYIPLALLNEVKEILKD